MLNSHSMNGEQLKQQRKDLGLTQKELGIELGVDMNTIYRYEKDRLPISKTIEILLNTIRAKKVKNKT